MGYKDYLRAILPPPLLGTQGTGFARGAAQHLDDLAASLKSAAKRGMPEVIAAEGDADSLAYLGTERGMPRYPSETDVQYGERLRTARTRYRRAGAEDSITSELEGLGWGGVTIVEYRDWPAAASPANAHSSPSPVLDANGDPWESRFWVYAETYGGAVISAADAWGTAVWGTDPWGTEVGAEEIAAAIRAIRKWKPARALAVALVLLLDGTTLDETWGGGSWGAATWGGTGGPGSSLHIPILK